MSATALGGRRGPTFRFLGLRPFWIPGGVDCGITGQEQYVGLAVRIRSSEFHFIHPLLLV